MLDLDPPQTATDQDTEIEIDLRPAAAVAQRAIVLSAVCNRAYLELARTTRLDFAAAEAERFDLLAWLDHESLIPAMTESEHHLMAARIRKISKQTAIEASWRIETLAPLVWALNPLPTPPPYDQQVGTAEVLQRLPEPLAKTGPFIHEARLRPLAEIATERERAELWYWRSQFAAEYESATPAERQELRDTLGDVAIEAAHAGLISAPISGDFPVSGRPYAALTADDQATVATIATNRLHALNWLCGFGPDWASVPLDL